MTAYYVVDYQEDGAAVWKVKNDKASHVKDVYSDNPGKSHLDLAWNEAEKLSKKTGGGIYRGLDYHEQMAVNEAGHQTPRACYGN